MNAFFKLVLDMFFPRRCIYCDRVVNPEELFCKYCAPDIPRMEDPVCVRCGRTRSLCNCRGRRRHYERCIAAMRYEDGAVRAVLHLKKEDNSDAIEAMAVEMVAALRAHTDAAAFDMVTCVPMHRREWLKREFNQSEWLARDVAKMIGVPFVPTLNKIYCTTSQKTLSSADRSGNLLGVFDLCADVNDKRVLIVDDVITTGATLHECAKMLKIGEAESVTALVFAAVITKPKPKDDKKDTVCN